MIERTRLSLLLGGAALVLALGCGGTKRDAKAPVLPPSNPRAVNKLSQGVQAARERDGRDRAIRLLEEAVAVDDKLWEARYNLGVLHAGAGRLVLAEKELERAAELAPNAEDVAVALAEVRLRRGDPRGAVRALEPFVRRHPKAAVAPIALIAALRESGEPGRAIEQAHAVLVRHARHPDALSELALSHLARGESDTAELLALEAQKADAKSAAAARTLGLVALGKGDDAEAFRHFTRASELDPTDTTARLNIATVLLKAGVYERARVEFETVLEIDPDDGAALLGLAAARRALAQRDDSAALGEAEALLRRVLEKDPGNLAATFNLGVLYVDYLKRPNDGAPLLRRFLEEAPENHPARAEAERLLAGSAPTPKR